MDHQKLKIGIDLGRCLVDHETKQPSKNSLEVLNRLKENHELFIISRVNDEQRKRSIKFLTEYGIYDIIPPQNVYYCFERRDKAFFADGLKLNLFIDDRPEVLSYMSDNIHKIVFNPHPPDLEKWENKLKNFSITNCWTGVEHLIGEYIKDSEKKLEQWSRVYLGSAGM
jgi:5'(3')-deoxyribonucleotidase